MSGQRPDPAGHASVGLRVEANDDVGEVGGRGPRASKPPPRPSAITTAVDSIAAASAIPIAVSSARRRAARRPRRISASARSSAGRDRAGGSAAGGAARDPGVGVEPAVLEPEHAVGDRRRLGLVGDDHDGPPVETAQQREHGGAVLGVEVAGRLVGQHQLGIVDERSRDREPLLLAAGELVRKVVGHRGQPELVDQLPGPALAAPGRAGQAGREQDVLGAAQLLDEVKRLKHEPDVTQPGPRQRPRALSR